MVESPRDDIARRMERIEKKFDWLDEHGTRAVNVLATQVAFLLKEVGELETTVKTAVAKLDDSRRIKWSYVLAFAAVMLPLYGMAITLIVGKGLG